MQNKPKKTQAQHKKADLPSGASALLQYRKYQSNDFSLDEINRLALDTDFNPDTGRGQVVINVQFIPCELLGAALLQLESLSESPYLLCDRVAVFTGDGKNHGMKIPEGMIALGTVSSITLINIFAQAGIPLSLRFGGILDVINHKPVTFQSLISYEHSTATPVSALMECAETNILAAMDEGIGTVIGTMAEIPQEHLFAYRALSGKILKAGFKQSMLHGFSFQPLFGIPVNEGMVGLMEISSFNATAAFFEAGLVNSTNLPATFAFEDMQPIGKLLRQHVSDQTLGGDMP